MLEKGDYVRKAAIALLASLCLSWLGITEAATAICPESCGSGPIAVLNNAGSTVDEVNWEWSDALADGSKYFWTEIRYYDGSSCSNWNLQTWGDCPP